MSPPIVVGVDGSAAALSAVRLAAQEAARRGRGLSIIHAIDHVMTHPGVGHLSQVIVQAARQHAEHLLAEAATTAAATDPAVAVTIEATTGNPATGCCPRPATPT